MAESVVINESEILSYRNKLLNYADFLSRKYVEFATIFSDVQNTAFIDEEVCTKMTALAEETKPLFAALEHTVGEDLHREITKMLNEAESSDTFRYPASILDAVKNILRAFF